MLWEAVPKALLPKIHNPKQRLTRGESLSLVTGYNTIIKVEMNHERLCGFCCVNATQLPVTMNLFIYESNYLFGASRVSAVT